ncbi:class II aldolase/adducin family protein [Mesorhizobium sp. SB112]|uniref:class II aldolase/adducin family protein n=1 Tax=Mesorhizobium sp. SB112 TaxID=3151853 RepID=UPI0032642536
MSKIMFSDEELAKRQSIIDTCLEMNRLGINQGTSGNVSLRNGDHILITPTSVPYGSLRPQDIVRLNMDGTTEGPLQASSEWRFHRDIMIARPDVGAIVHAHPIYSTIIAIIGLDIPAIHYMVAVAGGDDIRCAPYATFGSEELSQNAVKALEGRKACLLEHHGIIAVGTTLAKALWLSVEVETLARQLHGAMQFGEPRLLPKEEIANVLAKMGSYGHKD